MIIGLTNGILVGVGEYIRMRPGLIGTSIWGPPLGIVVADGAGWAAETSDGAVVGPIGVGGATMDASVVGIQLGVVTVLDTHAKPPVPAANSIYHHVPS